MLTLARKIKPVKVRGVCATQHGESENALPNFSHRPLLYSGDDRYAEIRPKDA
jgi:hypothetical protein